MIKARAKQGMPATDGDDNFFVQLESGLFLLQARIQALCPIRSRIVYLYQGGRQRGSKKRLPITFLNIS